MLNTTTAISLAQMVDEHINPEVPPDLLRYTCGDNKDTRIFVLSGAEVFSMFNLASIKHAEKPLIAHDRILDFGCGLGRIIRFLHEKKSGLAGCDINRSCVDYAATAHPYAALYTNNLMPPLKYPDASFNCIYSFSVFSHLSLDVENEWLSELKRVGRPGCLYLISIQGDWMIEKTLGANTEMVQKAGFWWNKVHRRFNGANDFPEYYESSYHTSSFIRDHWSKFFDIVEIIKGDNPFRYISNQNDEYQTSVARQIRPMGQDLVVARKRG